MCLLFLEMLFSANLAINHEMSAPRASKTHRTFIVLDMYAASAAGVMGAIVEGLSAAI